MNTSFASMQKTDRYNIIMYTKAVKTQPINLELHVFLLARKSCGFYNWRIACRGV